MNLCYISIVMIENLLHWAKNFLLFLCVPIVFCITICNLQTWLKFWLQGKWYFRKFPCFSRNREVSSLLISQFYDRISIHENRSNLHAFTSINLISTRAHALCNFNFWFWFLISQGKQISVATKEKSHNFIKVKSSNSHTDEKLLNNLNVSGSYNFY